MTCSVPRCTPRGHGALDASQLVSFGIGTTELAHARVQLVGQVVPPPLTQRQFDQLTSPHCDTLARSEPDVTGISWRRWWESYLRLVLERDLPQYGVRADALFMRRLLTILAHQHGGLLNASALGGSLGVSHHTVLRHLDVLESATLLRRLPPYFRNIGKKEGKG